VLHRVFVVPHKQALLLTKCPHSALPTRISSKPLSTQPHRQADLARVTPPANDAPPRFPRNEEITSPEIYLVLPDNALGPLRTTSSVLSTLDLKKQILTVVQPGTDISPPVCKIIDKTSVYAAERAFKKSKKGGVTIKAIVLNWGIDNNDLGHRLIKVKEFLEKGYKVEIMCTPKRRAKKTATWEEAEGLTRRIREAVGEVEGARETKRMEGKLLEKVTIFAEGKAGEKS